jgi:hypothetical protein
VGRHVDGEGGGVCFVGFRCISLIYGMLFGVNNS